MSKQFFTSIGNIIVWCMKYIFIPFGVAVSARIFVEKLLQPQPDRQKKKRPNKKPFSKIALIV